MDSDIDTTGQSGGQRPIVSIRGLRHHFGEGSARRPVLLDVDLDLEPGRITILTGPSGSGKTTLLTLIGALRSVQEGSVRVLGAELAGLSGRQLVTVRRHIGFIFQGHNLFESLTAYRNVRVALELQPFDDRAIDERVVGLLTELGLGDRMHHKPRKLSGGEKQRVAVARALANRPRLILADEPTAALDRHAALEVLALLKRLCVEDGCAVLMVTHDARLLETADRVIHLVDGRLQSDETVGASAAAGSEWGEKLL
jgi:putative ABC transport system ATP-binding protein